MSKLFGVLCDRTDGFLTPEESKAIAQGWLLAQESQLSESEQEAAVQRIDEAIHIHCIGCIMIQQAIDGFLSLDVDEKGDLVGKLTGEGHKWAEQTLRSAAKEKEDGSEQA